MFDVYDRFRAACDRFVFAGYSIRAATDGRRRGRTSTYVHVRRRTSTYVDVRPRTSTYAEFYGTNLKIIEYFFYLYLGLIPG